MLRNLDSNDISLRILFGIEGDFLLGRAFLGGPLFLQRVLQNVILDTVLAMGLLLGSDCGLIALVTLQVAFAVDRGRQLVACIHVAL